ncbi:hypothetical protein C5167_008218 [Papaver somniferum]|uniref:Uncharacterized protein n=1 Tax=Papaver somniferum TaxID=3469 RepID=A0A4Y7JXM9_PAPSO|nr:hypothetical protein C5167_008218 [Papaver somniferum]
MELLVLVMQYQQKEWKAGLLIGFSLLQGIIRIASPNKTSTSFISILHTFEWNKTSLDEIREVQNTNKGTKADWPVSGIPNSLAACSVKLIQPSETIQLTGGTFEYVVLVGISWLAFGLLGSGRPSGIVSKRKSAKPLSESGPLAFSKR